MTSNQNRTSGASSNENIRLIDKLESDGALSLDEFHALISSFSAADAEYARRAARRIADSIFGRKIFLRGLIEFTGYCKNDCYYCGLRRSNRLASRYRLSHDEIMACCRSGYNLGFRTFVLQGGEDPFYTDETMTKIIGDIRDSFPDCAITVSFGEKSRSTYQKYRDAGATRYLLRHETADPAHYARLHPSDMSFENRKRCLRDLKDIGFQTGCGMMTGSPWQTPLQLAEDMIFIRSLSPEMVGIGPFIPHSQTPFRDEPRGSAGLTLFMLSLVRIMLKNVLLPSTTALASIRPDGRQLGILAGANVIMPNLSPPAVREKYSIYDGKAYTGAEDARGIELLRGELKAIGCEISDERGDWRPI